MNVTKHYGLKIGKGEINSGRNQLFAVARMTVHTASVFAFGSHDGFFEVTIRKASSDLFSFITPKNPVVVARRGFDWWLIQCRASERAARRNRPRLWAELRFLTRLLSSWKRELSSRW